MKSISYIILYGFIILFTIELSYGQKYFQQQVDYTIDAQLDTTTKVLKVVCDINYTNNSLATLDSMVFHLWWNAMGDKQSEFANQQFDMGLREFYFAKEDQLGSYSDFLIKNEKGLKLEFRDFKKGTGNSKDIIIVDLKENLNPGETRKLHFEYTLNIPHAFSRFGIIKGSYQFTQWYPKPAVFDGTKWYAMSYLSVGEFYSEFGDYTVQLHLPKKLRPGFTGTILNSQDTDIGRLYNIQAENIHDFAWFASVNYLSEKEFIEIEGKKIEVEILHKGDSPIWKSAMDFSKESLIYYSNEIGLYPYPKITVVQGDYSKSSAMEYPMITIINGDNDLRQLEHLINHEIGHNWFYGILASNERANAWMDEGFTSFYDHKHARKKYAKNTYDDQIPKFIHIDDTEFSLLEHVVVNMQNTNRDLSIRDSNSSHDHFNYMIGNYEKMTMLLAYLEAYLGVDLFKTCIQNYFTQWKFKHPTPSDIKLVFEKTSGKNLEWFFNHLINSKNRIDYKIANGKYRDGNLEIGIGNAGDIEAPYQVSIYDDQDSLLYNKWYPAIALKEQQAITLQISNAHRVSINGEDTFLDINRNNNHFRPKAILKKLNPVKFKFGAHINDSRYNSVLFLPSINYNHYDGMITGLMMSSNIFPLQKFRWYVNGGFGLESKKVSGLFGIERDFVGRASKIRKWTIGLNGRRFDYFKSRFHGYQLAYWKLVPNVSIHFSTGLFKNSKLSYKAHVYNYEFAEFELIDKFTILSRLSVIHQLSADFEFRKRLSKNKMRFIIEYENTKNFIIDENIRYLKLSATYNKQVYISENSKFSARLFASYFIHNTKRQSSNYSDVFFRSSIALTSQGFNDYSYENLYLGRSQQSGILSRQIDFQEGGFKNALGSSQRVGLSNDYAVSLNLKSDIPIRIFEKSGIKPFIDLAIVSTKATSNEPLSTQFLYSGGLAWEWKDFIGVYLPLINSEEIKQAYAGSSLLSRISFKINLNAFNPWQLADDPGQLVD